MSPAERRKLMEQANVMIKKYEELEFRDDFMFGKVMQDKGKPIRLDIYTRDER